MIIFGTYVIHKTLGEGHFGCPQCLGVTSYRIRRGRWFFHILFIPLIPMKRTAPFVECLTCKGKWALGVLGPSELMRHREALADQFPAGLSAPADASAFVEADSATSVGGQPVPTAPAFAVPLRPAQYAQPPGAADEYQALGGRNLALTRGLATEVLRRAAVTDAGVEAVRQQARRLEVWDYEDQHVRHDVDHLDTGYLTGLVRQMVAEGRLGEAGARALVEDAVQIAEENGGLTSQQWDWIVRLGLDAGVGPTASAQVRDSLLVRRSG